MNKKNSKTNIYPNRFSYFINTFFFFIKILIPQPIVAKIPGLLTNEDIRISIVLNHLVGQVLDIGCGNNRLIKKYRKRGGAGIGIDIYPWDGVDVIVKNSSRLPFPDETFNTVTFVACFNHIPNREAVLLEARRLLHSNGLVILTNLNPIISRIWHAWNFFWSRDQQERGIKEGEVWGFTPKKIIEILKTNGFRLTEFRRFSWFLNQLYLFEKV